MPVQFTTGMQVQVILNWLHFSWFNISFFLGFYLTTFFLVLKISMMSRSFFRTRTPKEEKIVGKRLARNTQEKNWTEKIDIWS